MTSSGVSSRTARIPAVWIKLGRSVDAIARSWLLGARVVWALCSIEHIESIRTSRSLIFADLGVVANVRRATGTGTPVRSAEAIGRRGPA